MTKPLFLFPLAIVLTAFPGFTEDAASANSPAGRQVNFEGITVFLEHGRIEVKGSICLKEGLVEYLACSAGGKEHETLLKLDCKPEDLFVAAQTLGLKPGKTVSFQGENRVPTGDKVYLVVEWRADDKPVRHRVEDLIWDVPKGKSMARTHWLFVGSRFEKITENGKPVLMASLEKNLVATFHDPFVLFDHPLDTGTDDTVYEANGKLVPDPGTPLTLHITREPPKD